MRKNFIYRKRNWFGTLLEVGLPVAFLGILVAVKIEFEKYDSLQPEPVNATIPDTYNSMLPQSFGDYVTTLVADRNCTVSGITGFPSSNPFMKCNEARCPTVDYDTQEWPDATALCEFYILAVAAEDNAVAKARVASFRDFIYSSYPLLDLYPGPHEFVRVFDSPQAMQDYVVDENYGTVGHPKVGLGVVFQETESDKEYPYIIRQNSTWFDNPFNAARPVAATTPNTKRKFDNFAKDDDSVCFTTDHAWLGPRSDSCTGKYGYNGVLTIQRLIHDWIMDFTGAKDTGNYVAEHGVFFTPFPTPAYIANGFYDYIEAFTPLVVTIGLLYPFAAMIRAICIEKSLRLKELMKMMSVTESDINQSWFLSFFLLHLITATLATVAAAELYSNSQFLLLWLFFTFTMAACIVFAMFVASLLTKPVRATLVGLLVFFCGYFLTLIASYDDGNLGSIGLVSLHPVAAFSYGLQELGRLEGAGVGLNVDTLARSDNPSGYTFAGALRSLFFDMLFWGVLSWYFNRIAKSEYGQPLPLYFPCTKNYWCPGSSTPSNSDGQDGEDNIDDSVPIEPVPDSVHAQIAEGKGIQIKNLCKQFGEKSAVDGLNLSMYSGQVTALLGHNGAGKTTTISMLTGLFSPTDGTATVAGKDIRSQMKYIRREIGICFQHDCLFPQLTVQEHIEFFARLKGLYARCSKQEAAEKVKQAIEDVALYEKRNTLSKSLSGGMKRKLSVAIAFCGDSKTVLLDEPTSGMDPFSRRFTWNVIRQYREDRCIILTTHFMDEADILGDRIAIMAEGQLRCAGSSLFLKKHYGVGYQLSIEKNPKNAVDESSDRPSADEIEQNLQDIVKGAVDAANLLSNVGTEMSFQLPIGAASNFAPMFENLDQQITQKNIVTYGVSITTLDEVFLLVARGETGKKTEDFASKSERNLAYTSGEVVGADDERSVRSRINLEKEGLFTRHVSALFIKRALAFKRDKKAWICSTILPSIFVLIGLMIFKFVVPNRNYDSLTLTFEDYNTDIESSPRNPVTFNSPGGRFLAQGFGSCVTSSWQTRYDYTANSTSTKGVPGGQRYSLCGDGYFGQEYLSSPDANTSDWCIREGGRTQQCGALASISDSEDIMDGFAQAGAVPMGIDDIQLQYDVGAALSSTSDDYEATQFGAISFTHDLTSLLGNDPNPTNYTTYADYATNRCLDELSNPAEGGDYTFLTSDKCEKYRGLGYVVHYNFTAVHSGPLFQSLADEAILKRHDPEITITPTIHPMPVTFKESEYSDSQDAFIAWFLLVLSFPFITGSFATFVVAEAQSKARHLQTVSGVQPEAYWLSSFLWDFINYQLPCWIVVALFFIFDVDAFTTSERDVVLGTIVSLVLFGPAAIGFAYLVSFMFKSPSMCNLFVIIFNFLIGMAGPLVAFILRIIANQIEMEEAARNDDNFVPSTLPQTTNIVEWVLRLFPSFNLGSALFKMVNIAAIEGFEGKPVKAFSEAVAYWETVMQLVWGFVYIFLTVCVERLSTKPAVVAVWNKVVNCITCRCIWGRKKPLGEVAEAAPLDCDVKAEVDRVAHGEANDDLIVLNKLTKQYDTGKVAVNNVSYGIPPGQCFGLLGINGAGKTTTMAMLTAEFPPTSGDATLGGYSVTQQPEKTRRRIGYCPQFDAHFVGLTGKEHVTLYANIKGVHKSEVAGEVDNKLREVGLSDYDSNRLSAGYSGGMKRKLSVACATIGQPQIVFLDEPSTGMDPVARRDMWKVISDMVSGTDLPLKERTSVILTTHSMLECESLCPRIAIMANGRLSCLGSAQHLKTKFGSGYQVELKVLPVDQDDEDYKTALSTIMESTGIIAMTEDAEAGTSASDKFAKLEQALIALKAVAGGDDVVASQVTAMGTGQIIFRHASSELGVALDELTNFACEELRMKELDTFMRNSFGENYVLRERQDNKARYEITSADTQISSIFQKIENTKGELRLSDYGVSQTSLEQVFNTHAAEAEKLKHGGNDH